MNSTECILKCPVCNEPLTKESKIYICARNHSYDIAKQGFVNLLLANQKASKDPGDSKEMMQARSEFLEKGFYNRLSQAVNEMAYAHCSNAEISYNILDAGCGEGYYLNNLHQMLIDEGKAEYIKVYGFDISKEGVKSAAGRNKVITWAVGSTFHMPVLSQQVDCLLQIFAPVCETEFHRVLKPGGVLISVIPGREHLYGLKEKLYDEPYYNEEEIFQFQSLVMKEQKRLRYEIQLNDKRDIQNLLKMTPYYWKTNKERIEQVSSLTELNTVLDFILVKYEQGDKC